MSAATFRVRVIGVRSWLVLGNERDAQTLAVALSRLYRERWIDAVGEDGQAIARIEPSLPIADEELEQLRWPD